VWQSYLYSIHNIVCTSLVMKVWGRWRTVCLVITQYTAVVIWM
jgi:hypothetical protein